MTAQPTKCSDDIGDASLVAALDIGGSSVKSSIVAIDGPSATLLQSFEVVILSTREFTELDAVVTDTVEALLRAHDRVSALGISTTGTVNREGIVVSAGHFQGYVNVSWTDRLRARFPGLVKVVTINDGRASTWAEYRRRLDGGSSYIHAVVGTGVGGGIVYDGELMQGDSGQAGYIGHIKISDQPTAICSCGRQGCVETLASGPAIVRHANAGRAAREDSLDDICRLARAGNPNALAAFVSAGRYLGIGLGNAMNMLNPAQVSVGGGVVLASESIYQREDGGPYIEGVRAGLEYAAHRRVFASTTLRLAQLGNDAGMIGAALLTEASGPIRMKADLAG